MRLVVGVGGIDIEITERGGPYPWLTKVGNLFSAARAPHLEGSLGAGEAANMQVELDNTAKQASGLLEYALRASATLYDDGDLFFAGLVQNIDFGLPLVLSLEAGGGNLLDSDPLPLRSTRALGDYADDVPLAHILGDWSNTQFPLDRLSDTRFFVADHPMTVSKVFTGGLQAFGWAVKLESDEAGNTWTIVEFSAPVPQGTAVTGNGKGKLDDDTGELIENGGDVLRYFAKFARRTDDYSELRAQCSAADIRLAVRVAERKTYGQNQDAIAESMGAMRWHGGARLYPTTADPDTILDLYVAEVDNLKAVASLTDTADVLRLSYDQSPASGRALHYIELTASPQRFSGLSKEIVYPHLRNPQNAETVGRPVLQRLAGKKYDVSFNSTNDQIRPGMWVRPVSHPDWTVDDVDPVVMVQRIELERDSGSVSVKGEAIVGYRSVVTVTAHSLALPDTVGAALDVSVRDGVATFTITDIGGRPLKGVRLSLDGAAPKTSDAQGKAQFAATAGPHELAVEAPGKVPFTIVVSL